MPIVKVFCADKNAIVPKLATEFSACCDLHTCLNESVSGFDEFNNKIKKNVINDLDNVRAIVISPGERLLMPTGLIFDIPKGYSLRIHPRSGLSIKYGLSLINSEGVVDCDYVEPSFVLLTNYSKQPYSVKHHERIAQMEIVKDEQLDFELTTSQPEKKSVRDGGFGSTGSY